MTPASRALARATLVAGSVLLLTACSKVADEALAELQARKGKHEDPFTTDVVARGVRELERKLGAVKLYGIEVSEQRVVFSVQDPAKPGNVDAYEVRNGMVMPPRPVQLMADIDVGRSVFAAGELPLERIPELARAAVAALAIEDGKVRSLTVRRKFSAVPAEMRAALERARQSTGAVDLVSDEPEVGEGGIAVELSVNGPRRLGYVLANQKFEIVRTSLM